MHRGSWAEVEVGGYISADDGTVWRCDVREPPDWVTMTNRHGETVRVSRPDWWTVNVMTPTPDEAQQLVQTMLGATIINEEMTHG